MGELKLPNAITQQSIKEILQRIENGESVISANIDGVTFEGSISAKTKNNIDVPLTVELDNEGYGVLRVVDVGGVGYDSQADAIKTLPATKTQFETIYNGSVTDKIIITDIDPMGADSVWVWVKTSKRNWTLECGLDGIEVLEGTSISEDGVYPPMVDVDEDNPIYHRKRGLLVLSKSENLQDAMINRVQTPFRLRFKNTGEANLVNIILERKW